MRSPAGERSAQRCVSNISHNHVPVSILPVAYMNLMFPYMYIILLCHIIIILELEIPILTYNVDTIN